MQPIPIPVGNVNVYPYVDWPPHAGIGPAIPPVIEGASGTYSVGTLGTQVFYNLDLKGGERKGPLHVGGKYVAWAESEGGPFQTPWLLCTSAGDEPTFGRTTGLV